jgi:hypothetical protein
VTGFVGEPGRLVFIADQPAYLGPGGLTRITVTTRSTADGVALILRREPLLLTENGSAALDREAVLASNLEALHLGYLGIDEDSDEPRWVDNWTSGDSLPGLIEVRVKPVGEPAWPVLLARPQFMVGLAADPLLDDDALSPDDLPADDLPADDLMEPLDDARS